MQCPSKRKKHKLRHPPPGYAVKAWPFKDIAYGEDEPAPYGLPQPDWVDYYEEKWYTGREVVINGRYVWLDAPCGTLITCTYCDFKGACEAEKCKSIHEHHTSHGH